MSVFRFPLDRVLSWRQTQLSLAEADLELSRSDLRTAETDLANLYRREYNMVETMRVTQNVSAVGIADQRAFREWAIHEEKTLRARIAEYTHRRDTLLAIVTEAGRKAKLMERLKERRRDLHDVAFNRELEQVAAESAISGWCRTH